MPVIAFDEKGIKLEVTAEIGRGAEGSIWIIKGRKGHCLKQFFTPPDMEMVRKLKCLVQKSGVLSSVAALPVELTYGTKGGKKPKGAIMPFIGGHSIHELYGTASRKEKFAGRKYDFLIQAARNVAFAFHKLHQEGFVVGDISENNIKVLPDATIRFLDTDSFQYTSKEKVYLCTVGTPIWTAPELHGADLKKTKRTLNHDNFGLAQLIFLLLVGRNPYAGRSRGNAYLGPEEAVRSYAYAFAPQSYRSPLLPPPNWIGTDSLPAPINALFCRAFMKGSEAPAARPTTSEWLDGLDLLMKEMVKCQDLSEHLHWKGAKECPWCAALFQLQPGIEFFPSSETEYYQAGYRNEERGRKDPAYFQIAASFYQLAIRDNHPEAMARLGWLYYQGEGISRDLYKAGDLLNKSAQKGCPEGMLCYGKFLIRTGRGITSGIQWLQKSKSAGVISNVQIAKEFYALCYGKFLIRTGRGITSGIQWLLKIKSAGTLSIVRIGKELYAIAFEEKKSIVLHLIFWIVIFGVTLLITSLIFTKSATRREANPPASLIASNMPHGLPKNPDFLFPQNFLTEAVESGKSVPLAEPVRGTVPSVPPTIINSEQTTNAVQVNKAVVPPPTPSSFTVIEKKIASQSNSPISAENGSPMTTAAGESQGTFGTPALTSSGSSSVASEQQNFMGNSVGVNFDPSGAEKAYPIDHDGRTSVQSLVSPEAVESGKSVPLAEPVRGTVPSVPPTIINSEQTTNAVQVNKAVVPPPTPSSFTVIEKKIASQSNSPISAENGSPMTTAAGESQGTFGTPALTSSGSSSVASEQQNFMGNSVGVNFDPSGAEKAYPIDHDGRTSVQSLVSPEAVESVGSRKYPINSPGKNYLRASERFPGNIVGQYLVGDFVIVGEDSTGGASIFALEDEGKGIFKRRFVIKNYSSGLLRGQSMEGPYKPRLKFARGNPLVITGKIAPGVYSVEKTR